MDNYKLQIPATPSTPTLPKYGNKRLATAANLTNLLPTGTVLAFQTLIPSFSNNGKCEVANKCLTLGIIVCCSVACFLSSFTDSFSTSEGKLFYGIATFKGMYVFNNDEEIGEEDNPQFLDKFRICLIDFVHAFASLIVFLVFAFSGSEVQTCLFPKQGPNRHALMVNLPLGAGLLASFLFMIFPTRRRGIGYADLTPSRK
ncbi:hypothetical protein HS088_TW12G00706 [Tripterygium wilfordii]|uniref:Uncharacterized protein n=1 Tax=Tripterygium wilfordii TaxID=458696 RepID=A0A7J7CZM0_TRIWF|nr:protein DMP10-like [Tripterygium wilfordii]KAF5739500.1 hypothetical protein HS088_TW12G00706 [Tripterygium wilfordii]